MRQATERRSWDGGEAARFEASSGVVLIERHDPHGQAHLELRAPDGALVLEYRPAEGVCRLHAPRVEIEAMSDLPLAGRRVAIEGERLELSRGQSSIALDAGAVKLRAVELEAEVTRASWTAEIFRVTGDRVETEAKRLVQRAGELETDARQIVERAKETFREVAELAQTRAGRLRLVAEDSLYALGRRAFVKAREDLKLRGEHIHLD
ncbi:MAG: DUF3540 domain-containing protein [Sandaracinaceae bacterium]|nr:DUF3540 domain-containing protein [Sandaracinaceae bacterium]